MSILRALLLVSVSVLVTGCASQQQMQSAMNEIDAFWGEANQRIFLQQGIRTCPHPPAQCLRVAKYTASSLGFTVQQESTSYQQFTAAARTPKPFTDSEFQAIKKIEEPMMQAIAATHVGSFTSGFFYLESGSNDVILDARSFFNPTTGQPMIQVEFRLKYRGPTTGIIYGKNPPPEAVRLGLKKWWLAFDKNALAAAQ